jgi:glycosyltransferase involved in cell wall biosynthesis
MPSPGRPLRILTITHNYPRFPGDPAGAFVQRIATGAAAHGHQVEVIAPHTAGTSLVEDRAGVRLQRFRYAPDRFERVAYTGGLHQGALFSPLVAIGFPGFLIGFARAVRRAVSRLQPDLIHAHWWFPSGWFAGREHIPYVITCHGSDVRLLDRGSLVRRAGRGVFQRASRVTAVSNFLANDLMRLLPGSIAHLAVTPMPVDVAQFLQGAVNVKLNPPRILYAGNLVRGKGVDVLLRAAAELKRRRVNYELKILGQGPAQASLRVLARELGIDSQVTWSPFVAQSLMPLEYGTSTVTVLPSQGNAEGLGLTLVEALLAGSAAVGTPAGGIPEVVLHEQTGLIARAGDPVDLADQLQRLLSDAPLRERLTRAGKELVLRTYSPEPAIGRFLDMYHAVADRQPNR